MSSQTWAAWLLDSYASSVSPVVSDFQESLAHEADDSSSDGQRSAPSTTAPRHSMKTSQQMGVSPYGPYTRTGRGGAGNFHWDSDQPTASSADVEAQDFKQSSLSQRRAAAAKLERVETNEAVRARKSSSSTYTHLGRGGAGNWSTNINQSNEPQTPRSPTKAVSSPTSRGTATVGRGGAGNMRAAGDERSRLQGERERREREEVERRREEIELEVREVVRVPEGVVLSQGRRRSMVLNG